MFIKYEKIINGSCKKPILIDVHVPKEFYNNKVIIFSHGFKGFKDWGPFNKIAEYFVNQGFIYVKFNFSYNGTSIENPLDFIDLDAFGNNNFCKELDDLGLVIDWVNNEFSENEIILFGHSRGGSISILKILEDNRISKIISWASPSNFLTKLPDKDKAKEWKKKNVAYIYNGRTKQNMPMYYQFYKNCLANKDRLDIKTSLKKMNIPHLHIHGDGDPTVLIDEAYNIKKWSNNTKLHIIKDANHVFDSCHPYNLKKYPKDLKEALDVTLAFLKR